MVKFEIIMPMLVVAIFICVILAFYFNHRGKKNATEPVEAEIIDINYISSYSKPIYTLTVKYTVNGVEYISKNVTGFSTLDDNMKIGNKIMIKYDPKNPNDIRF